MDLKKRAKQTSPARKRIAVSIKLFYQGRPKGMPILPATGKTQHRPAIRVFYRPSSPIGCHVKMKRWYVEMERNQAS
jgi:hypothetical protein